jgi:type II secretory pathway pseudopilin PulG
MPDEKIAAPGTGSGPAAPERGYILVMLLAFITIMGILLTVALPNVATEVQRDQEAELIFRGQSIANAIRLYKARTGGYPLNLEDLTKIRPRIIRKLYLDPMTRDGEWDLITAVQPGASGDKTGLPIVGVKSHCQKDSFAIYQGKTLISDWTFSAADNLLGVPGGAAIPPAAAALAGQTGAKPAEGVDLDQLPSPKQNLPNQPIPNQPNPSPPNPSQPNPSPPNPSPPNPDQPNPDQPNPSPPPPINPANPPFPGSPPNPAQPPVPPPQN